LLVTHWWQNKWIPYSFKLSCHQWVPSMPYSFILSSVSAKHAIFIYFVISECLANEYGMLGTHWWQNNLNEYGMPGTHWYWNSFLFCLVFVCVFNYKNLFKKQTSEVRASNNCIILFVSFRWFMGNVPTCMLPGTLLPKYKHLQVNCSFFKQENIKHHKPTNLFLNPKIINLTTSEPIFEKPFYRVFVYMY
jgi:hypothetical protein